MNSELGKSGTQKNSEEREAEDRAQRMGGGGEKGKEGDREREREESKADRYIGHM